MSHFHESPIVGRRDLIFVNQNQKSTVCSLLGVREEIMDSFKKLFSPQKKNKNQVLDS